MLQVLREARRYLGVVEEPPGSNRGTVIDYVNREAALDPRGGYPWCCSWAMQVGRQALGYAWPCPRTASVQALADWAAAAGCLLATPVVGDLFVLWEPQLTPPRYGHVGYVEAVAAAGYNTLEGNTNPGGGREGYGVFARQRALQPTTRFIRWTGTLMGA